MKNKLLMFAALNLLFAGKIYCQFCNAPITSLIHNNPTDAQVTLSSGSIIEFGPPGYTPGTGATAGAGGTLINCFCSTPLIYPLTPNTAYNLYARRDCGASTYSPNSTPIAFTTPPCPETFTYGTLSSILTMYFSGIGYYSNYYYSNGFGPSSGTEKIIKFTPASSGYYVMHLQRPITNFTNPTFMTRVANTTCNFFDINGFIIDYTAPEFYNTTYGNNASGIYCENLYYRLGPFNAGTTYDFFFDANDTTIDDGMVWPYLNYSDIDLSYIGCNASPLSITSSAGLTICAGMSTTLTQNDGILTAGGSYNWYSGSCGGTLVGTGTSLTVSPAATTTYYVRGEAPCGNSICKSITINVITAAITPSGNLNVCGFTTLTTPIISSCTYQWKKNGVNLPGYVNPTFQTGYNGSYTVEVHSPYCTITSQVPANLTVALNATITASGPTSVCAGDSVVLTANAGPGVTYQWNINGTYGAGITTQTCTIKSTSQVFVAVNNGSCFNFSPHTYVTVGFSTATIYPLGTVNTCPGTPVNLYVNTSPGLSYQWKLNGIDIPGTTSYNYAATLAGNYTVAISNGTCSGTTSNARTVAYYQVPVSTITTNTPTTFCSGGNVFLYAPGGNYGHQWKKNGNNIAGATSSYYGATSSGNYKHVLTNTFGCSATSAATVVTVNPLPSAAITTAGPTTFCDGSSVTLNAATGANLAYQWKKGGNNITGATSSSYTAATGGTYKVNVTNASTGCTKTTPTGTLVTVNPKPAATITPQGPTTFCAGGNVVLAANSGIGLSYAWKKNSAFIGVNTINYTATTAGSYQARVTDVNGCNKTSTAVTVTMPCKIGEGESERAFAVKVYPNPSNGDFIIEMENGSTGKITITIYDISGRMILSKATYQSEFIITNKQLNSGIYFAEIIQGNSIKKVRLVKLGGE